MANISSADGTLLLSEIKGCTAEEFWDALSTVTNGYYGMEFDPLSAKSVPTTFDPSITISSVSFQGSGRWTFSDTVNALPSIIEYYQNDKNGLVRGAVDLLEETTWTLILEYSDIEVGNGVLYKEVDEIYHDSDTAITESYIECVSRNDYDCNLYNLVEHFDYDIPTAVDTLYFIEDMGIYEIDNLIDEVSNYGGDEILKSDILGYLEICRKDISLEQEESGHVSLGEEAHAMKDVAPVVSSTTSINETIIDAPTTEDKR